MTIPLVCRFSRWGTFGGVVGIVDPMRNCTAEPLALIPKTQANEQFALMYLVNISYASKLLILAAVLFLLYCLSIRGSVNVEVNLGDFRPHVAVLQLLQHEPPRKEFA